MPTPAEVLENTITENREVYHVFYHRPSGEWVLMKHNGERATKRGDKNEVYRRANELLDDPGLSGTGALLVVGWEIVDRTNMTQRIRRIMVGEHMGARRIGANESKFSTR